MKLWEAWGREPVIFDGSMGTMLQNAGLPQGKLPECWNLERPDVVRIIHDAYLDAGCHVISTNTFGANRAKLRHTGYGVGEIIERAVDIAREAVYLSGREARIALDMGPTGQLLAPMGDLPFEEAVDIFAEMAAIGEECGVDLILIETMSDMYELKAAVLGAKEGSSLPVVATVILDERGKLLTGGDIPSVVALLEGLGADAIGVNCGVGLTHMEEFLAQFRAVSSLPIVMTPNAGLPHCVNGITTFDVGPGEFSEALQGLVEHGAWAVGGCCGTTPEHMRRVVQCCEGLQVRPIEQKHRTVVSSYSETVVIGEDPVIIGERINPTGKSRFKQALREHDMNYIVQEGVKQQLSGAHILDVNVGLPEIDEVRCMVDAVSQLQSVLPLPLQIDTSNPAAMEAALRMYNGKALVNSVNGKQASMKAVFPLVKKYGGVVVALTLDEEGIPETAEGRLAIARKIVDTAAAYGIEKKDILVDALTMAVSAMPDAARVTLDTVKLVRQQLGVGTVLGVSNISFGLPQREALNAAFYTMALEAGLSAGIINPNSAAMMQSYRTWRALMGKDAQFADYIAAAAAVPQEKAAPAAAAPADLQGAILKGLKENAHAAAKALAETKAPLEILHSEIIPALDQVGKGFEAGTLFLPQLLMSAEAAKAAFEVLKQHLVAVGEAPEKGEKIVLATVHGDIHDIGKNIVKVLLENYHYDVIDLGKDVPPEAVVQMVVNEHVPLVGLSALMTTTVPSMAETIRLLRGKAPWVKIMVGGAVLTQDYADAIGADFYGKDAMASVHYAQTLFGKVN